jgi:hypothetical protein
MSSRRTNTTNSQRTETFLEKLQFEETNFRESSFDDPEITYEEFSGIHAANSLEFQKENGNANEQRPSTLVNEEVSHKTNNVLPKVDLSSDSEIDFGVTLDVFKCFILKNI